MGDGREKIGSGQLPIARGPGRHSGSKEMARTRSPIVLDCPTVDLIFPLIRRLMYEILLATVLH